MSYLPPMPSEATSRRLLPESLAPAPAVPQRLRFDRERTQADPRSGLHRRQQWATGAAAAASRTSPCPMDLLPLGANHVGTQTQAGVES